MKSEVATLRSLNRRHEKLVIRLTKKLEAAEAEVRRLKRLKVGHGRN
jgi:hypothetical protein